MPLCPVEYLITLYSVVLQSVYTCVGQKIKKIIISKKTTATQTVFAASTYVFNGQLNSAFLAVKRLTQLASAGSSDHTLPRRVDLATHTHTDTDGHARGINSAYDTPLPVADFCNKNAKS